MDFPLEELECEGHQRTEQAQANSVCK